jgi:hypothetical protein
VQASIYQDLASLLASTHQLLACPEPSLAVWQNYMLRRNQMFERLQELPTVMADRGADAESLQRLITAVLESDKLLTEKIGQQMSKIGREMVELADRRRIFNAYVLNVRPPCSYHYQTA